MSQQDDTKKAGRGSWWLLGFVVVMLTAAIWRLAVLWDSAGTAYPQYRFRATRKLVEAVDRATDLLARKGPAAFDTLNGPAFRNEDFYLYVYRVDDATCLYHGSSPEMVGQNTHDFHDMHGRPVHELIIGELASRENPHGWVHFQWHRPGEVLGEWKSACHRAVTLPDGTACYVGGGINRPLSEEEFAHVAVAGAAALIEAKGKAALGGLMSAESPYSVMDSRIFILNDDGTTIIDPAFGTLQSRNVLEYRDASGRYPFQLLFQRLAGQQEAEAPLYARTPGSMHLHEKYLYAQRSTMDGRPVVVGMVMNRPGKVWQR